MLQASRTEQSDAGHPLSGYTLNFRLWPRAVMRLGRLSDHIRCIPECRHLKVVLGS